MSTYRERRLQRAEKLREWAEKREVKADAAYRDFRTRLDGIPPGQPILVGHHSEKRHRRELERIDNSLGRYVEHTKKAHEMAGSAAEIEHQADRAIYDDDPDALERLEERIAELEAERERRKAANTAYRKEHRAELAAMRPYERSEAIPYPTYSLSNLSGNIARLRKRIPVIKARQERDAAADDSPTGVTVIVTPVEQYHGMTIGGYATVAFAVKPDRAIIADLKAAGFWWSKGAWHGKHADLPASVAELVPSRSV